MSGPDMAFLPADSVMSFGHRESTVATISGQVQPIQRNGIARAA